ncbi:acyltransferase [bacterium]|nr:acyltransferase [bacterium]
MKTWLPGPVLGVLCMLLLALNTVVWGLGVLGLAVFKLLIPVKAIRRALNDGMDWFAYRWCHCNRLIGEYVVGVEIIRVGFEPLTQDKTYFLAANHRSWADLFALCAAFDGYLPPYKVFAKRQLMYIPLFGQILWALDFPMMKRHSKQAIAKNPKLKGEDIRIVRKKFEQFEGRQICVLNFLEGTRNKPHKHAAQGSPYKHLLKPKSGGLAFALKAMGKQRDVLLDINFLYPDGDGEFWELMTGRIPRVLVDVREIPVPEEMMTGDYADPEFRAHFQAWLDDWWAEKDARIGKLLAEYQPA